MQAIPHEQCAGRIFFVGLDVHKKQWTVTIRTEGIALKTFSMNPSPQELGQYLARHYPGGIYKSVYEAGFCGFWIHDQLCALGIENMVIHAADVPTTHKERNGKNDRRDSRKLSRELEHHALTAIYVPTEPQRHLRSLCRLRERQVRNRTRVKNRIKGHLQFYGIAMPAQSEMAHWSHRFLDWLKTVEFSSLPATDYLRLCLSELDDHRRRLAEIHRLLRQVCQQEPHKATIQCLRSVPGIGFVLAVTLYTELCTMDRFRRFDDLASYVGLVPSITSSDDHDINHGLTPRHKRYLRHLLIESAWVAIRHDADLLARFLRLTQRMKKQEAIIRIAKILLRRIRYVWQHHTEYVTPPCQETRAPNAG